MTFTDDSQDRQQAEDRLDDASALSFPASDPPCFMGSVAVAGAPPGKKTPCALDDKRPGRRRQR